MGTAFLEVERLGWKFASPWELEVGNGVAIDLRELGPKLFEEQALQ